MALNGLNFFMIVGLVVSLALNSKTANAEIPLSKCTITKDYRPNTTFSYVDTERGRWHTEMLYALNLWNPHFSQEGFFEVQGNITVDESNAKQAELGYRRAREIQSTLEAVGVPASNIEFLATPPPWSDPKITLGFGYYCWQMICECPGDVRWLKELRVVSPLGPSTLPQVSH